MGTTNALGCKVGLVMILIGFGLLAIGSAMLEVGNNNNDVLTIVRGGLVFISGVIAIVYFGIWNGWQKDLKL
jgi:uncharacterized membrane protein